MIDSQRTPTRLLIATAEAGFALRVAEHFEPQGFQVIRTYSAGEMSERIQQQSPDAIIVDDTLPDTHPLQVCRRLRLDPRVAPYAPIVLTGGVLPGLADRVAALSAGAWDLMAHPIDLEELRLKITTFTAPKRFADWARSQNLVDVTTGLYTMPGVLRHADGLISLAVRQDQPIACAVFESSLSRAAPEPVEEVAVICARALRATARVSDVIGRLDKAQFVVVGSGADAAGAARMSSRLVAAIQRAARDEQLGEGVQVRVGYDALESARRTPARAADLVDHATRAAGTAFFGSGDRWIRRWHAESN